MKGILVQSTAGQLLNHFKMSIQGLAHYVMLEELTIVAWAYLKFNEGTGLWKHKTKQLAYIVCLAISGNCQNSDYFSLLLRYIYFIDNIRSLQLILE